ncbi:MAG: hypothetical protein Kow0075_01820 [Salibacteraceae bacterium]
MLFLASCGPEQSTYTDELHRPSGWEGKIGFTIDTVYTSPHQQVIELNSAVLEDAEGLIEQLFAIAFSGDVVVCAPDYLGQPDTLQPLTPKQLVDRLNRYETVEFEDIHTGEMRDTVVDLSFDKDAVSGLTFYFKSDDKAWGDINYIGLGEQVFDEAEGKFRGIKHHFFVRCGQNNWYNPNARLLVRSDSLGVFRAMSIDNFSGNAMPPKSGERGEVLLRIKIEHDQGKITTEWDLENPNA